MDTLANPVLPFQINLSCGNNWFEIFYPYHWEHDLSKIFDLFKLKMSSEMQEKLNSLGFGNIQGNFRFVDQAEVLDQLKGDYRTPGFFGTETEMKDELGIAKLSRVHFHQYVFI